jgi:hypothetical protein
VKEGRLVHHHRCRCVEGRWVWDSGKREQWRWVELWWRGALTRKEVKCRRNWVMWRVAKIEIIFLYQWRVGVGRSGEDSLRQWWWFNASVSTREGRRQNKALPEDEVEVASSSWLNGKEVWHGATVWWCRSEERRHRGGEREETATVGLARILLDRKIKKIHVIDLAGVNRCWRFKVGMSCF